MKRILAAIGVISLALLGATATASASPPESPGGGGDKITICHATGSETNPYVEITVDLKGLNGHANANHQHTEDIIPPNNGTILPAGQNWTAAHQAIHHNACVAPGGPVTPPGGNGNGNGGGHDDKKITICHATGSATNPYVVITISLNGLNGHAGAGHQNGEDIIPPNSGTIVPAGQNWTAEGIAIFENDCAVPAEPPVVTPPVVTPPVVTPPVVTPPGVTPVVPGAVTPAPRGAGAGAGAGAAAGAGAGAVAGPGAAAGVGAAAGNNPGYNVQTAVSDSTDAAVAPWMGGVAAMLLAGLVIAGRRTLAKGQRP